MKGFPLRTLSARKKQKKTVQDYAAKARVGQPPAARDTGKRAIASVNVGLVALDGVLALLKAPAWTANLIEWTLSFTVVAYHATFAADLKGARVALLLPDPARPKAQSTSRTSENP